MKISRRRLTDYVKTLHQKASRTIIFPHPISHRFVALSLPFLKLSCEVLRTTSVSPQYELVLSLNFYETVRVNKVRGHFTHFLKRDQHRIIATQSTYCEALFQNDVFVAPILFMNFRTSFHYQLPKGHKSFPTTKVKVYSFWGVLQFHRFLVIVLRECLKKSANELRRFLALNTSSRDLLCVRIGSLNLSFWYD